jgi:hypothetical protein
MRSAFSRDNKTLFLRMGLAQAVTIKHRTCIRSLASPPDQRAAAPIGPEQ